MKLLRELIKKEFFHILRDRRTLIIIFGIPIVQIILFGYVITNEIKDAKIAIYDKSKDNITMKMTNKMLSSDYFKLVDIINSDREIEVRFREGKIKEVVVFQSGFAKKLEGEGTAFMQIIEDASDPNAARLLSNYTRAIVSDFIDEINPTVRIGRTGPIVPEVRMVYNPQMKGVFTFVPGVMALLLTLISAVMTALSITREKEFGTMEMLLVSPFRPFHIVLGKVIPYISISFINTVVILLISNLVFGLPVRGSIVLLLAEGLLFIITVLSLGILISTSTDSQLIAMMIAMVGLMMPTIVLSGFIYPIENMPFILQLLANLVAAKWFILIIRAIMFRGAGLTFIWKETLILMLMTFLFTALSIKKFRIRLQ